MVAQITIKQAPHALPGRGVSGTAGGAGAVLQSPSLACPSCGQIDRVRKATAIIGDEAPPGSGRDQATQTRTGAMLRGFLPPPEPRWARPWGPGARLRAAACVLLAAAGLVGAVRGSLAAAPDAVIASLAASAPGPLAVPADEAVAGVYAAVAVGLLGLAATAARNRGAGEKRRRFEREHDAWEGVAARWPRLAYCGRCDVVFEAGRGPVRAGPPRAPRRRRPPDRG
jgi:hypothetical protein